MDVINLPQDWQASVWRRDTHRIRNTLNHYTDISSRMALVTYKRHVLGCNATTNAPFSTPSPFLCTQRPNRVSCPTPATSSTVFGCCARPAFPGASAFGRCAHSALSANSGGGVQKWSEFTTPGAATVPTSANDLSFASSFQSRIEPSQEPMCVSVC